MKPILTVALSLSISICCLAQNVSINTTADPAHSSAILDISSENKGILIPRLPSSERQSIQDPATGLLVYDSNTQSFWYFANDDWHEISHTTELSGPASGDLSGIYPAPQVVKLQNNNVAAGTPADKYVLKWDQSLNTWKGMKDSLSLPHIVNASLTGPLFSITNIDQGGSGTAIIGRRTTGSGITPNVSMGIWGDNANGIAVVGTNNNGIGVYGFSQQEHGTYGYSAAADFAGVYGSHANDGGIGVMGLMYNDGFGIYGKMLGNLGTAGIFESTSPSHSDTTIKVSTTGIGSLASFEVNNPVNTLPAASIIHHGFGSGLSVVTKNPLNTSSAIDVLTHGTGNGLNVTTATGRAGEFTVNDPVSVNPALTVNSYGYGSSAIFKSLQSAGSTHAVSIEQHGLGRSLFINATNPSASQASVRILTAGDRGMDVTSAGTIGILASTASNNSIAVHGATGITSSNSIGVKGESGLNGSNGIGVFGAGGINDVGAIGVKGINTSDIQTHGAVTGINTGGGVGVYGESMSTNGIGITGMAGQSNTNSIAALFKNINANNTKDVVSITSSGKGRGLFIENTNLTNGSPLMHIRNAGNGNFLTLESHLGDVKTSITRDGHFATDGTVTVKEGKGIIRNSNSTQLRYESFNTETIAYQGNAEGGIGILFVDFPTPFSAPPDVFVAQTNFLTGNANSVIATIFDVTTTGCTVHLNNMTGVSTGFIEVNWRLVAIGPE